MEWRWCALSGMGPAARIQLKCAGHHDYGLWALTALVHGEFDRFSPIDEEATIATFWVLNDPLPRLSLPTRKRGNLEVDERASS